MVKLEVRETEEFQNPGAWHWKCLTMGETILFGSLFFGSLWFLSEALSPPFRGSYLMFDYTYGSPIWLFAVASCLMFIVAPPSFVIYHSIRYQVDENQEESRDNTQTNLSADKKKKQSAQEERNTTHQLERPDRCPDCGEELDREDNFCSGCGNNLIPNEDRAFE